MVFASGTEDISVTRTEGHFGNPISIFEVELTRSSDMKRFLARMRETGIADSLAGQEDARTDEDSTFHFRLDKQKAYREELALAEGKDVIDVRLKVATYPARRESAVRMLADWFMAGKASSSSNDG